jgi:hypothetical protein
MSKHQSPLLGYNNNVRHKGRVFHIQTEDSGVKHPHVITHIFMDGGRILKSTKTSYAEHVGNDDRADTVRKMMKDQHKAMFVALRDGQLDHLIPPSGASMPPPPPEVAPPKTASVPPPKAASVPPPKAAAKGKSVPPPSMRPAAPAIDLAPASDTAPMTLREPQTELTLDDLDALGTPGLAHQPTDLPPPPSNIFRERSPEPGTGGRYRTLRDPRVDPDSSSEMLAAPKVEHAEPVPPSRIDRVELKPPGRKSERPPRSERPAPASARRSDSPKPGSSRSPKPGETSVEPRKKRSSRPPRSQQGEGRYAPARPAAIFGPAKPSTGQQSSIFGEDLISDKSLDEVILSYLAEDLEGEK